MQKKRFSPRYKRMVPLASLLPKITKPALSKVGLAYGKLALNWDDIVGAEWCLKMRPIKLSRSGVLHIAIRPAHALEAQYASQIIMARLNKYLGGNSIQNVHYVQQQIPTSLSKGTPTPKKTPHSRKVTPVTPEEGGSEELSSALTRLKIVLEN